MYEVAEYRFDDEVLRIWQDTIGPENPCDEEQHLGLLTAFHPNYALGDSHLFHDWRAWMSDELSTIKQATVWEERDGQDLDKGIERLLKAGYIVKMLYLYDHSGIALSTRSWIGRAQHAEWDSGPVGFYTASPEQIRTWSGKLRITAAQRKRAEVAMDDFVEYYNHYLAGRVYGFTLVAPTTCPHCDQVLDKHIDSCGGFVGWFDDGSGIIENLPQHWQAHLRDSKGWK